MIFRNQLLPLAGLLLGTLSPLLSPAAWAAEGEATPWMDVEVGQSVIFRQDRSIGRVLISDDKVAELKLLDQDQFQVRGLAVGSTDLWVWYRDDMAHPANFELTVHRDLSGLVRRLDQITAGKSPRVYPLVDRIAVEGPVDSVQVLEQVSDLAKIYDPEFANLMSVTGDHQIQLEVVFAEVNRTALREMGLNTLWGSDTNPLFTYHGQAQPLAAGIQGPNLTYSTQIGNPGLDGYVNGDGAMPSPSSGTFNLLGVIGQPINVSAILSVLEQNSISKILARPTLVALSGQQAEFLAGGEIPIPVAQFGSRITIEFKEYGVKLVFVPTVLGNDVVDMRVYVEVSDVDAATSIRLTGIEIPGFISRKSQSHLRVESGKTFAMAGMVHESMRATYAKVPILGDIPVIGALFRYVQHRRTEDELMIFVTPRLVRPMAAGEVPAAPGTTEDNNPNDFELFLLGLDHRVGSQAAQPTGPVGLAR